MLSAAEVRDAEELVAAVGEPAAVDPRDPRAPHVVYVAADRGDLEGAIVLATLLKRIPVDGDDGSGAVSHQHRVDLVIARLWLARIGGDHDLEALEAARSLLANLVRAPLEPRRLTALRLWLAGALHNLPDVGEAQLREASAYLTAARVQATLLGLVHLEITSLAALALMRLPSGDLESARRLAGAALAQSEATRPRTARPAAGPDVSASPLPYWRFVAVAVQQWATYFQGEPTDSRALAEVELSLPFYASDVVTWVVGSTVVALGHSQAGDMAGARALLHSVVTDPRFGALGVWRLFPLVADAYLAIASGDDLRARRREEDLTRAGAPAEQLLVRAVRGAAGGDVPGALTALRGVTSRQVRSTGLTYPTACALEAMLFEQQSSPTRADDSIRRALGAAEPYAARRIFSAHDPALMIPLVRRAVAHRPADRWCAEVLAYLEQEMARTDPPQRIHVPGTDSPAHAAAGAQEDDARSPLTDRERQVLALIEAGASPSQIAKDLFVSPNTVKTHLRSIRQKLGADHNGQAVVIARSAGWLRS